MAGNPSRIGKYDVEGIIGEGGMGVVYKGRDPLIDRVVAIKTIRTDDKAEHEELLKRLHMEARSAGKLQHPNIVVIHDFGEQDDLTYLVMEYVEGRNLASIIKSGRQMPFSMKIDVILQLCQGLDYAHGLGVTHRDIKPGNIAITSRGTAKILDFGLARVDSTRLTKTGFTSGTIAYMSPERMRGEAGPSDDIFALGAVAYELLTYRRAFPGTSYSDVVTKVLSEQYPKPPSSLADLPPELDPIILKSMKRDLAERYQNPGEFGKAVEGFRQTLAYQNFASRADLADMGFLREEAPVSSTANPYSAGAMTPTPSSNVDLETRQVSKDEAPGVEKTMQTRVRDLTPPDPIETDRTSVREVEEPAPAPPETERAIPTEVLKPVRPTAAPPDPFESQKTMMGSSAGTARAPASPREGEDKTVQTRPLKSPPAASAPREDTGSHIRTAVMKAFRKVRGLPAEPEPREKTVVDESRRVQEDRTVIDESRKVSRQPAPGGVRAPGGPQGPATGRTTPYIPGARPGAAQPAARAEAPAAGEAKAAAQAVPVRPARGELLGVWVPSATLLVCILAASALAQVGGVGIYLAVYLASVLVWMWLLRTSDRFTLKQALTVALLLRVGLAFFPPVVANESLRGLWDGKMIANGLNPYELAPLSSDVTIPRPAWFHLMDSPQEPTTTPPWALLIFMIVAWIGGGPVFWRLLLIVVDLFTVRLLAREKSGHAMILYATCPIIVLEGIWNGRIELVAVSLLVAASWAARQRRTLQGGVLTGIGVGTSFLALPALPALWGTAEKMLRMVAATLLAAIVPLALFTTAGRVAERLRQLVFEPELSRLGLIWFSERIDQARLAESIARNAERIRWEAMATMLGGITAADLAALTTAAGFLILLIFVTKKSSGPDAAVANCLGVFFLLTALFSPAGWLLLVPFAITARQPLWIMYALVTPLTYLLPDTGTSWMLLATLYALPPIAWLVFRESDGRVHLFDSAAGGAAPDPAVHSSH